MRSCVGCAGVRHREYTACSTVLLLCWRGLCEKQEVDDDEEEEEEESGEESEYEDEEDEEEVGATASPPRWGAPVVVAGMPFEYVLVYGMPCWGLHWLGFPAA
jgi:hypothetical protein